MGYEGDDLASLFARGKEPTRRAAERMAEHAGESIRDDDAELALSPGSPRP